MPYSCTIFGIPLDYKPGKHGFSHAIEMKLQSALGNYVKRHNLLTLSDIRFFDTDKLYHHFSVLISVAGVLALQNEHLSFLQVRSMSAASLDEYLEAYKKAYFNNRRLKQLMQRNYAQYAIDAGLIDLDELGWFCLQNNLEVLEALLGHKRYLVELIEQEIVPFAAAQMRLAEFSQKFTKGINKLVLNQVRYLTNLSDRKTTKSIIDQLDVLGIASISAIRAEGLIAEADLALCVLPNNLPKLKLLISRQGVKLMRKKLLTPLRALCLSEQKLQLLLQLDEKEIADIERILQTSDQAITEINPVAVVDPASSRRGLHL